MLPQLSEKLPQLSEMLPQLSEMTGILQKLPRIALNCVRSTKSPSFRKGVGQGAVRIVSWLIRVVLVIEVDEARVVVGHAVRLGLRGEQAALRGQATPRQSAISSSREKMRFGRMTASSAT